MQLINSTSTEKSTGFYGLFSSFGAAFAQVNSVFLLPDKALEGPIPCRAAIFEQLFIALSILRMNSLFWGQKKSEYLLENCRVFYNTGTALPQ